MQTNPFTPGATVTLAVTTSTGNVALGVPLIEKQVRIASLAANAAAFIRFGSSTVTAAVTDVPILPGTVTIFSVGADVTHVAAITGASTATLYFTSGQGA